MRQAHIFWTATNARRGGVIGSPTIYFKRRRHMRARAYPKVRHLETQASTNVHNFARNKQFIVRKRPSARRGPGIASVDRNVRSKCRCSCVLQFTS